MWIRGVDRSFAGQVVEDALKAWRTDYRLQRVERTAAASNRIAKPLMHVIKSINKEKIRRTWPYSKRARFFTKENCIPRVRNKTIGKT